MRKTLLVLPIAVVFLLTPPRDPARISAILRDVRAMLAATAAAYPGPLDPTPTVTAAPAVDLPVDDIVPDPTAAPQATCLLDWTRPYSPEAYIELANCRHSLYLESGAFACPPEGTVWASYFRDAFCVPVPAFGGTLPPPPPPPATSLPPAAYP